MYLSFFIAESTPVLDEIRQVLEEVGFKDLKTRGEAERHRLVFFNGRKKNNFSYTAHKLVTKAPDSISDCPFLVRVGSDWTLQGLKQILKSYIRFSLPLLSPLHFPVEKDYLQPAKGEEFFRRLDGIRQALIHCENTNDEEVQKFEKIISNVRGSTIGEMKRKLLDFFLTTGRIDLPWGNPPTSERSRGELIEWIKMANSAYPREKSDLIQAQKDLRKVKKLQNLKTVKFA